MSTDIAFRGTAIPYKVERVPKQKKNKDWTKCVVHEWMLVDDNEIVDDYRLADYSEALNGVRITSHDEGHCVQEGWVQIGFPTGKSGQARSQVGVVERRGQGFVVSPGVVLTCGHVVARARGDVKVISPKRRRAKARVTPKAKVEVETPRKYVMRITGELLARDEDRLEIAWYGGDQFSVPVTDTVGFDAVTPGDWFKAVIVRLSNGVVQQALLTQQAEPPTAMSEEELEKAYSEIPPADLEPAD